MIRPWWLRSSRARTLFRDCELSINTFMNCIFNLWLMFLSIKLHEPAWSCTQLSFTTLGNHNIASFISHSSCYCKSSWLTGFMNIHDPSLIGKPPYCQVRTWFASKASSKLSRQLFDLPNIPQSSSTIKLSVTEPSRRGSAVRLVNLKSIGLILVAVRVW